MVKFTLLANLLTLLAPEVVTVSLLVPEVEMVPLLAPKVATVSLLDPEVETVSLLDHRPRGFIAGGEPGRGAGVWLFVSEAARPRSDGGLAARPRTDTGGRVRAHGKNPSSSVSQIRPSWIGEAAVSTDSLLVPEVVTVVARPRSGDGLVARPRSGDGLVARPRSGDLGATRRSKSRNLRSPRGGCSPPKW